MKKLEKRFDHEKLLSVYYSLELDKPQITVTSPTGKDLIYPSGDLTKYNLDQNDFTQMNDVFKGTYVEEVYNDISKDYDICRGRFMTLSADNRAYTYHYDVSPRLHIPLKTNEDCMFIISDEIHKAQELGCLYELDATKKHTALNLSKEPRIHFVVCLKTNKAISDFMKRMNNAASA